MPVYFKRHTKDEHADSLAKYLPDNKLFAGKYLPNSRFRKFLKSIITPFQLAEDRIVVLWDQIDPSKTSDLIQEWEKATGIPDPAFKGIEDIVNRRRDVMIKLGSSIQIEQDYIDLAALFGLEIEIGQGTGGFELIVYIITPPINLFPYPIPFLFGDTRPITQLEKVFRMFTDSSTIITFQEGAP